MGQGGPGEGGKELLEAGYKGAVYEIPAEDEDDQAFERTTARAVVIL